jgi:hypothetical protein
MIRHLHPTDSPALFQFKQRSGPDEAFTLTQALKGGRKSFPLMKYGSIAFSPRAWQSCWVKTRRARVQALLRAGPRSGPYAWELSDLFLEKGGRDIVLEVFEQVSFLAGSSGARRVFLRLPAESDLFDLARAAGYQAVFSEAVFRADSTREVLARTGETSEGLELRPLYDEDTFALFRLYCAAVPINVRSRMGQTVDDWSSSKEYPGRNFRDWGLSNSNGDGLAAHVQSSDAAGGRFFSIRCRESANYRYESLIAAGVGQVNDRSTITIVPSYDSILSGTLTELGFRESETYDVMVKTLVAPVTMTAPGLIMAGLG